MKKAYVIGAGPLGLSAALELKKNDYQVVVVDSFSQIGGLAQPFDFGGDLIELYYHFFYWGDHVIATEFLRELIDDVPVEWRDISTKNFVDGAFVNFDSPLSLLKAAGTGFVKLVWILLRIKFLPVDAKMDKVSALAWARRAFGKRFFEGVWRPLLQNKFGQHADKVSAYWLATRIKRHMSTKVGAGGRCRFGYLTSTYQPFFEVLKQRIVDAGGVFKMDQKIVEIAVVENQVVRLLTAEGAIEIEAGAPVFSCIPLGNLKDMGSIATTLPYLNEFHLVGAVLLILKLKKPLSDAYWTTVSDESVPFDVIIQQNRLYSNTQYEIVYLSRYYDRSSAIFSADSQLIADTYTKALLVMYPNLLPGDILEKKIVRTQSAAPLPSTDMLTKIPPYKSTLTNFYHAGFEHIYPEDRGVGNSIAIGKGMITKYLADH